MYGLGLQTGTKSSESDSGSEILEDSKPMGCSMKYSGCVNIFKFICLLRPRFTGKFPT